MYLAFVSSSPDFKPQEEERITYSPRTVLYIVQINQRYPLNEEWMFADVQETRLEYFTYENIGN